MMNMKDQLALAFSKAGRDEVHIAPTSERLKSVHSQLATIRMYLQILDRQIPDAMTNTMRMDFLAELMDIEDLVEKAKTKFTGNLV